jgi:hypothetical protein
MNICLGSSLLDVQGARCPLDALDGSEICSIGEMELIAAAYVSLLRRVRVAIGRNTSFRDTDAGHEA